MQVRAFRRARALISRYNRYMEIVEKLKSEIAEANEAYRIGRPVMDDLSYDELLEQYRELVPVEEYEAFARTLHEKSGKVKLPYLLGSLTKLKCQEPESIAIGIVE